jgi:Cd2+/Zn2+-exporting ATPase
VAVSASKSSALQSVRFRVPDLDCAEELRLIERGLRELPGIVALEPNYLQRGLRVEFDPARLNEAAVSRRLSEIGFPAEVVATPALTVTTAPARRPVLRPGTLVAAVLLVLATAGWLWVGDEPWVVALAIAATLAAGVDVARAAWRAIRLRAIDMNVLMTVAAVGAIATGHHFEAATAMLLFGVSLWLEDFSFARARSAVAALVECAPRVAHRLEGSQIVDVDPLTVSAGDLLLVRPGERIAADGRIERGSSSVNQAAITGESVPVDKVVGDDVYAGTLNGEQALEVRATRPAQGSVLAHIARLVDEAQSRRSPTERFVDAFARRYTPAVMIIAAIVATVPNFVLRPLGLVIDADATAWDWLYRGLVLLVIACPCALVISTPVTIVCGLYAAARRGLLVKGGQSLEQAGRVQAIAFDKTGTVTTGRARVTRVLPSGACDERKLLAIAAALESQSEHPLARAIVAAAEARGIARLPADKVSAVRGLGVEGTIGGTRYAIGSRRMLVERGVDVGTNDDAAIDQAPSAEIEVLIAAGQQLLGAIYLADTARSDAAATINRLRAAGLGPFFMLTGDRREVAEEMARRVGIEHVHAELLPQDKLAVVERLVREHGNLAMIGDGVNDAPALAASSLGVALGGEASDTALETADVVVLAGRFERLVDLMQLGRRTRRKLAENIVASLVIKTAILLLAAAGFAGMWIAVAADVGASLLVIANGMRLLRAGER